MNREESWTHPADISPFQAVAKSTSNQREARVRVLHKGSIRTGSGLIRRPMDGGRVGLCAILARVVPAAPPAQSRFSAPNLLVSRCRWRLSPNDYFGTALPTLAPLCGRTILQVLQPAAPIKKRLGCPLVSYLPSHITSRRSEYRGRVGDNAFGQAVCRALPLNHPRRPISPPRLFAPDPFDCAGLRCFSIGAQFDVELLLI